jgi:hypothetical protein
MKKIPHIFIAFLIVGTLCAPLTSFAQQIGRGPDPLSVSVSPEVPAPGESATITITSTPINLSQSQFIWKLNGSTKSSGPGRRSFTFTMGASGGATVIAVDILPLGGDTISRTFTFHPGSVTILWEANTYTPPFYRGKSLYTPGADVRIVAIADIKDPNGVAVPSSQLTFKWSIDGEPFADRSGLAHNTFYLSGSQLQPEQVVSVDVLRPNGLLAARAELEIPKGSPMVRFYKSDPLRGMLYHQSYIGAVTLTDTETTLVAEPYFISGTVREPERVLYTWTLNEVVVEPAGSERSKITLRQTAGQTGSATLGLRIQNTDLRRLLQQAAGELRILFGN